MYTRAALAAVVLVCFYFGALGGAWISTMEPAVVAVDAGVLDAPSSLIAAPQDDRVVRTSIASHCAPGASWPCEPSP